MSTAAAQLRERTSGAWRLAGAWVLILAFALQSYVTQTHFHPAAFQLAPHSSVSSAPPGGSDEGVCPLCQAVASAGAFVAAGSAVSLPSVVWEAFVCRAPAMVGLALAPTSFAWRSRAPPQV